MLERGERDLTPGRGAALDGRRDVRHLDGQVANAASGRAPPGGVGRHRRLVERHQFETRLAQRVSLDRSSGDDHVAEAGAYLFMADRSGERDVVELGVAGHELEGSVGVPVWQRCEERTDAVSALTTRGGTPRTR
jgi:hypothetical protein